MLKESSKVLPNEISKIVQRSSEILKKSPEELPKKFPKKFPKEFPDNFPKYKPMKSIQN